MLKPNISIVTICYNAENDIEKTMRSVLGQLYNDMEYIIVDGMSEDKTMQIVNNVIKDYPQKKINIISEPDKGIYDAMNKGINLASGKWLNFMNAGDIFSTNTIIDDIANSGLFDRSDFIYSDFYVQRKKKKRLIKQDYSKGRVLHQSCFYRKTLHNDVGKYIVTKPYIVSDYWFFVQIKNTRIVKYNMPISINDTKGISMQGYWCQYQKICVDYMFRRISIPKFFFELFKQSLKNIVFSIIKR